MRRFQCFDVYVDDDVVNVNLVFNSTVVKDLDDAIERLKAARKKVAHRPIIKICAMEGCNKIKRFRASGKPGKYCSGACKAKAYRIRKAALVHSWSAGESLT